MSDTRDLFSPRRPSSRSSAPSLGGALRIHRRGHPRVTLKLDPLLRYTFGRTARSKILFPDIRVSRAHGELEVFDRTWAFTDMGSANGSYLFRVEDLYRSETTNLELSCIRILPGRRGHLKPGEGVLLGCRDAWLELLESEPLGCLPDLVGVNPPSVLVLLGIETQREMDTPDLEWTGGRGSESSGAHLPPNAEK